MRRRSDLHRWLDIALRTLHLLAVAACFVEVVTPGAASGATAGVLLTGAGMVASELWRHGLDWLRWGQAWLLFAKLATFAIAASAGAPLAGLVGAVVLGSVASHAPGAVRHAPMFGEPGPCARCHTPVGEAARNAG